MRRAYLLQLLLFLLGALILDRLMGMALVRLSEDVRTGQSSGGSIHAALERREVELMFFGSSRTLHHLVPEVLEARLHKKVHNAGNGGHGIYYARMLEALLLQRGTRARVFILQADCKDLYEAEPSRDMLFAPYYGQHPDVDRILEASSFFAPLKLQLMTYRYNSMLLPMLGNWDKAGPEARGGFEALHGSMAGKAPLGLSAAELDVQQVPEIKTPVLEVFADFFADAKRHGVEVGLIFGPRYREVGLIPAREQRCLDELDGLARANDVTLMPMDEVAYPALRDGALYYDGSHLNEQGARLFSERMADALREARPLAEALALEPLDQAAPAE